MNAEFPPLSALIHHREPALVVEEIESLTDDEASCAFTVRPGPFLAGDHLWEPELIEGVAQTAAAMSARRAALIGARLERGWLVGVRRFVIHRAPRLGERVVCRARLGRRLESFVIVEGTARVGEELVAEGELKFYEVISE